MAGFRLPEFRIIKSSVSFFDPKFCQVFTIVLIAGQFHHAYRNGRDLFTIYQDQYFLLLILTLFLLQPLYCRLISGTKMIPLGNA